MDSEDANQASCILRQVRFKRYSRRSRARGDTRTLHSTHWLICCLLRWVPFSSAWAQMYLRLCPSPLCPPRVHLTSHTWWMKPGLPIFRALPLPCIILNANQRTKNGGGLGTRLYQPHSETTSPASLWDHSPSFTLRPLSQLHSETTPPASLWDHFPQPHSETTSPASLWDHSPQPHSETTPPASLWDHSPSLTLRPLPPASLWDCFPQPHSETTHPASFPQHCPSLIPRWLAALFSEHSPGLIRAGTSSFEVGRLKCFHWQSLWINTGSAWSCMQKKPMVVDLVSTSTTTLHLGTWSGIPHLQFASKNVSRKPHHF